MDTKTIFPPVSKHEETPKQTAAVVREAWRQFVSFLRRRDDRVTRTRQIVLERVFARHDHFRADDLAADLSRGSDRVSRGTVYRTLALMVQAGLVREVRDGDTHVHYEHVLGHPQHQHMICQVCGRFIEFSDPKIDRLIVKQCEEEGFAPSIHNVTVLGRCADCGGVYDGD